MSSLVVPPDEPGGNRNVEPEMPAACDTPTEPERNQESRGVTFPSRRNSTPSARPIELLKTAKSGVFSSCVVSRTLLALRCHAFT